jgi:hypothetical protein
MVYSLGAGKRDPPDHDQGEVQGLDLRGRQWSLSRRISSGIQGFAELGKDVWQPCSCRGCADGCSCTSRGCSCRAWGTDSRRFAAVRTTFRARLAILIWT